MQTAWEARNNDALAGTLTTEALTHARILITQGYADRTLNLLQQLHVPMETRGQISRCIEIELLQALALERLHRRQEALHKLECTLRLAASGNIVRTFLIADTLIVSLGTVKRHLTHIMGKLQARNRTEAVARARELGCLSG